jgi:hypothetical protein
MRIVTSIKTNPAPKTFPNKQYTLTNDETRFQHFYRFVWIVAAATSKFKRRISSNEIEP